MPILWFFLLLAIGTVIVFIVRLALNPLATLIIAVRLISFLVAAVAWIAFFVTFGDSGAWGLLILAIPATAIWLGTFAFNCR